MFYTTKDGRRVQLLCDGCGKPVERVGTGPALLLISKVGLCWRCCQTGSWGEGPTNK